MMMGFEFLPHTADIRIRVWGRDLEDLFLNALAGLAHVIGEEVARGSVVEPATVKIIAASATNLLVDFLNEVLYLSNVNKAVYGRAEFKKFSEIELEGILHGYKVDGFAEDVKAVTYHGAEIKVNDDGEWEVEIVFDI